MRGLPAPFLLAHGRNRILSADQGACGATAVSHMGCCSTAAGILWRVGCIALLRWDAECLTRHPKCVLKAKR